MNIHISTYQHDYPAPNVDKLKWPPAEILPDTIKTSCPAYNYNNTADAKALLECCCDNNDVYEDKRNGLLDLELEEAACKKWTGLEPMSTSVKPELIPPSPQNNNDDETDNNEYVDETCARHLIHELCCKYPDLYYELQSQVYADGFPKSCYKFQKKSCQTPKLSKASKHLKSKYTAKNCHTGDSSKSTYHTESIKSTIESPTQMNALYTPASAASPNKISKLPVGGPFDKQFEVFAKSDQKKQQSHSKFENMETEYMSHICQTGNLIMKHKLLNRACT